jgi:RimJ/RimL family protein N-acetyltransferase
MAKEELCMKLETERLILRDMQKGDEESLRENMNNINVSRYLLVVPFPYTESDAQWFVNHCIERISKVPRDSYSLGIALKGEDKIIGGISLRNINEFESTASLGYWLGEKYWRKGYMSEAFKRIIEFGFNELKLRRLNVEAFSPNVASNELIKKMGFKFEGTRRQMHRSKSNGEIYDDNEYGLLKDEWLKMNQK